MLLVFLLLINHTPPTSHSCHLSLHDALPISHETYRGKWQMIFFYPKDFTFVCPTEIKGFADMDQQFQDRDCQILAARSEDHTSELQSRGHLVCRLLLENKKYLYCPTNDILSI